MRKLVLPSHITACKNIATLVVIGRAVLTALYGTGHNNALGPHLHYPRIGITIWMVYKIKLVYWIGTSNIISVKTLKKTCWTRHTKIIIWPSRATAQRVHTLRRHYWVCLQRPHMTSSPIINKISLYKMTTSFQFTNIVQCNNTRFHLIKTTWIVSYNNYINTCTSTWFSTSPFPESRHFIGKIILTVFLYNNNTINNNTKYWTLSNKISCYVH